MPKLTIPHPLNDGLGELRITFKAKMPQEWSGLDEDERDEMFSDDDDIPVEVILMRVEEGSDGDFHDVSDEWRSHSYLDELEEEVRVRFLEHRREKYVDRLAR